MRFTALGTDLSGRLGLTRAIFALLFVAVLSAGCRKPVSAPTENARVSFVYAESEEVTDWDEFTGRLEPIKSVEVRARVSGYLESIHFEDGETVEAGQVLFVIDPRPYAAVAAQAHAAVAKAQAARELAESDFKRAERLRSSHVIAEEEFDDWRNKLAMAKAELARAQGEARAADLNLDFCQVKAPIGGRLSKRFVDEGNLVQGQGAGATLLTTIVPPDPLYVTFDLDEGTVLEYSELRFDGRRGTAQDAKRPVRIALENDAGFDREGVLTFVDNRLDPNTGTLRGRAVISNHDGALTPGMFVRVQIQGRGPYPALLLSEEAIGSDQSRQFVMVVDKENVAQRRFIETGRLYDGRREITKGLGSGDRVILDGLLKVHAGDVVQASPASARGDSVELAASERP